jgi:protein disulfide-isomerase A1
VDKWPAFAIQETVKNQKFPLDQSKKLTEKEVGDFVQNFVDGKIKPSIKSEPIPEKQDGPVKVIVAHNYEDVVMEADKDVLVEFYAPWCGHCKAYVSSPPFSTRLRNDIKLTDRFLASLAPKYEELASMYTTNPALSSKVVIAKVDATANDVPDEIQGFPTIKLFPAGAKDSPILYSGSRTIEDLAAFIKENGKYKADAYEGKNDTDEIMSDANGMGSAAANGMGSAAAAATEKASETASEVSGKASEKATETASEIKGKVKSKVSEAAGAVKTAMMDSDGDSAEHDEL